MQPPPAKHQRPVTLPSSPRAPKISKKEEIDEREEPNVKEELKVHIVKVEKKTKATKKEEIKVNIVKVGKKPRRLRRRRSGKRSTSSKVEKTKAPDRTCREVAQMLSTI